jgi:hypothetical protein
MKTCTRCKKLKLLAAFCSNRAKADGLSIYCRVCTALANREKKARKRAGTTLPRGGSRKGRTWSKVKAPRKVKALKVKALKVKPPVEIVYPIPKRGDRPLRSSGWHELYKSIRNGSLEMAL